MSDVPSVKDIFKHFNPSKAQARKMQTIDQKDSSTSTSLMTEYFAGETQ